jgi:hypothetical protein
MTHHERIGKEVMAAQAAGLVTPTPTPPVMEQPHAIVQPTVTEQLPVPTVTEQTCDAACDTAID